jgi:hypothetical protein
MNFQFLITIYTPDNSLIIFPSRDPVAGLIESENLFSKIEPFGVHTFLVGLVEIQVSSQILM